MDAALTSTHPAGLDAAPLARLGLPGRLVEALLAAAAPGGWLPFQRQVLAPDVLAGRRPLVLAAPTSSGKTLLAEVALWRGAARGERGMLLVPTRALAEEVFAGLAPRWEAAGRRVLLATRDRPGADGFVRGGHFDLLVTIPEKARTYVAADPGFLRGLGTLVADEVQSLGEPGRGETLDLLLTTARRAAPDCRVVALTTPGRHVAEVAAWLGAVAVVGHERPRDLWEGVLDLETGRFRGRSATGAALDLPALEPLGVAPLPADPRGHCRAGALEVAARLAGGAGQRVLVFVPTREMAHDWALGLAALLEGRSAAPPAEQADAPPGAAGRAATLLALPGSGSLGDLLAPCLERGVGVHHGELPAELRGALEEDFRAGTLRALVATSTLARGVNLRADAVVQVPVRMATGAGRADAVPLDRRRLVDQGGRAGRVEPGRAAAGPGLSLVVAAGEGMAERLWHDLFTAEDEPLGRPLAATDPATQALHAVVLGGARSADAARDYLAHTLAGAPPASSTGAPSATSAPGGPGGPVPAPLDLRLVEEGLAAAERDAFLLRPAPGAWGPTALGEAVVAAGLRLATARLLVEWLAALGAERPGDHEVLHVLAATADGADHPVRLTAAEARARQPLARLRALLGAGPPGSESHDDGGAWAEEAGRGEAVPAGAWLRARWAARGGFGHPEQVAARKALAAAAWLGPRPTAELERAFGMFAGAFQSLGRHLGWLAESAARLAETLGVHPALPERLADLGRRLPVGLPAGAEELAPLARAAVGRDALHALAAEGFVSLDALAGADEAALAFVLGPEAATRVLAVALEELRWRERLAALRPGAPPAAWLARPHPQPLPASPPPAAASLVPAPVPAPAAAQEAQAQVEQQAGSAPPAAAAPLRLLLDDANPGVVRGSRGGSVTLTQRQDLLLRALAEDVGRCVDYPTLLRRAWRGVVVEQQQIAQNRRRLLARLATLGFDAATIETRPGIGLCLFPGEPERLERTPAPHGSR